MTAAERLRAHFECVMENADRYERHGLVVSAARARAIADRLAEQLREKAKR